MRKGIFLLLLSFILDGLFIFILKYFRFSFPPTEIGSSGIIGYSQYYGYPFSFDTGVFVVFLLIPILVLLVSKVCMKS